MFEPKGISLLAVSKVNSVVKEDADEIVAVTAFALPRIATDCVVNLVGADVNAMLGATSVLPEVTPNDDPMQSMITNNLFLTKTNKMSNPIKLMTFLNVIHLYLELNPAWPQNLV